MDRMEIHAVRIPDEIWQKVQALAKVRFTSASEVVRNAVVQYVARNETELPVGHMSAVVSDDDWYYNHRVPLHKGGMPIAGTCDFCDEQYKVRGWKG